VWGGVWKNEYKVLSVLCENRGETVDRDRIYSILGAEEGNMGDVYICHLRKKIDNPLGIKLIYTVRGKGYMLKN
jgi:two-component system copper resistance phosphate regulon response regulator CusR